MILKNYWIAIILMFGSRFFQSSNFPIGLSMIRKHSLVIGLVDFSKIDIRTHTHEHTKPVKLSIQCLSSFLWNSVCCWARVLDLSSYPFVGRTIESKQNICVHKRRRKKNQNEHFKAGYLNFTLVELSKYVIQFISFQMIKFTFLCHFNAEK